MASTALELAPGVPSRQAVDVRRIAIALICLAAFGVRVWTLTAQSAWNDEAGSVWHAQHPLGVILAGLEPDHLPLYFLLLKGWLGLAGDGDFPARFFSLVPSVLTVPLVWWLGRRIAGPAVGGVGALFAALSPASIYYGQEIRMYAWLPPLAVLAIGSFIEGAADRRRWWIVHAGALALATQLHYFGALVMPVSLTLALGRAFFEGPGRWIRDWAFSFLVALLLSLPYVLYRLAAASGYQSSSANDLSAIAAGWRGAVGLLLGPHLERVTADLSGGWASADHLLSIQLLLPLLLLLAVGLAPSRRDGWPVLIAALAAPTAGISLALLTGRDFTSRYLVVAAPAVWLMLALGVVRLARLGRPLALAGVAALVLPSAFALALYHQPAYARDDFRAVADYVAANAEPGDVILLNAGYAFKGFDRYFLGDLPTVALPVTRPPEDSLLAEATAEAVREHPRAWLVLWQDYYADPNRAVQGWLERNGLQIDGRAFQGVNLARYLLLSPIAPAGVEPNVPIGATFGEAIRLVGYDLAVDPPDDPTRRSSVVRVRLFWQPLRRIETSYRVFVQLVNPVYQVYGAKDNRPVYDRFPTTSWEPGTTVVDEYRLVLLPGTPPGEYRLSIGLYDEVTGRRLLADGRSDVLAGPVRIERSGGVPDPSHPTAIRFGESVELIGFDLAKRAAPGDQVRLTLHWRSYDLPPPDLTVFVHLVDPSGNLVAQRDSQPAAGGYPTGRWRAGEYLRDFYDLDLPTGLAPGEYTVRVGLYRPDGERIAPRPGNADRSATLATIDVR
ncbi:MAG: glycosyltransferase family 39 protein [Dehalococcoidia bacterium]